ncbi:DUF2293 domain-containing protein [Actinokineospora sp. NBRC 105648]|uniref:DUF2293 domain-containing protein n=1 Tax=Actinokineospora sp. NBRC 105648 TaxID=3032206 RepID=UPI00249FDE0D|nr:DUF2293 domain-containing protein [Actinokineospora sp. NBRC 105648]GLZ38670.1 hypothetical protein Acsp05_22940 [Actinokineospora sp. NBRC 105648]
MSARLDRRVAAVAEELLRRKKVVVPLDVLAGLGWLSGRSVQAWELGRKARLDTLAAVPAERLAEALVCLHSWAAGAGLNRSEVDYVAATRDRRALRFGGTAEVELAFRTQWTDPGLSAARLARVAQRQAKAPDLVVVQPEKHWHCAQCRETGEFHFLEDDLPLCLDCADMGHLVYLPAGDAALTRRARKASGLAAVVVRWSKSRKRFDRRGLLVEHAAREAAEEQCLADEEVRERRKARDRDRRAAQDVEFQAAFAVRIGELFPGLAADRAQAIAEHAGTRSSGRVGRSAAGRAFDEHAVTLAVVAAIRHEETDYDAMLMAGVPRATARERIRDDIDRVLTQWRLPS